jgi:hypothetical protein
VIGQKTKDPDLRFQVALELARRGYMRRVGVLLAHVANERSPYHLLTVCELAKLDHPLALKRLKAMWITSRRGKGPNKRALVACLKSILKEKKLWVEYESATTQIAKWMRKNVVD